MPLRKCSVLICQSSSNKVEGKHKSYFSFPRAENLRKKWVVACHNKIDNFVTARVCSDHFKEEDYFHNSKPVRPEYSRKKRLKPDAVPSVNLDVNLKGKKVPYKKSISLNYDKENSKEFSKRKDGSRINGNVKELAKGEKVVRNIEPNVVKRKTNILTSDKENAKELPKKNVKKNTEELSKEQSKRKKGTRRISNENSKEKIKQKNIANEGNFKELPKQQIIKGNNKEISKDIKKSNTSNDNEVPKDLPKHKIGKDNIDEGDTSTSDIDSLKNFSKKKIGKGSCDKDKSKQSSKKNSLENNAEHKEIKLAVIKNKYNSKSETKKKHSIENGAELSEELPKHKNSTGHMINESSKKQTKRKSSIGNEISKKFSKKRIRFGKNDSDDSLEDYPKQECITKNVNYDNGKNKITYKSPSEMADNIDLLKYLNYLKQNSERCDQPILFWADD